TAGTSSHRSRATAADSSAPSSHPKVTMREARSTSARVTCRGWRPLTSMPSSSSPCTTLRGTAASGSRPAASAWTVPPCCSASRRKCSRAMRLLAEPWRHTKSTVGGVDMVLYLLLHEHPFRPEQGKRDQADDRRDGHEQGIADLPAEQYDETAERDERGEPVA